MIEDTNIISSSSLFSLDDLELLKKLDTPSPVDNNRYQNYINDKSDINSTTDDEIKDNWKLCPICHFKLQDLNVSSAECSKCGVEASSITNASYIIPESKINIKKKIMYDLKQKNNDSIKHKIPIFILEDAIDKFITISEKKIHRGSVQKGIKAMLIKYALDENNMSKSTKIIGQMYKLTDKQLSAADAILREYDAQGVIKIKNLNIDRTFCFINNYIKIFNIDEQHTNFMIDIINEAEKIGIHLLNNFKPSTKATGAFLLYTSSFPELKIKKCDIIKESGLTTSTVNRYYNLLFDNIEKFRHIYDFWNIKMPI
jgi:hypothetical protein